MSLLAKGRLVGGKLERWKIEKRKWLLELFDKSGKHEGFWWSRCIFFLSSPKKKKKISSNYNVLRRENGKGRGRWEITKYAPPPLCLCYTVYIMFLFLYFFLINGFCVFFRLSNNNFFSTPYNMFSFFFKERLYFFFFNQVWTVVFVFNQVSNDGQLCNCHIETI